MAGGNIAGTMISGSSSKAEARRARKQQLYLARNAHQIEVADLKAAGLNPILSAGGSGAHGSPVPQAQIPDYGAAFGRGVSSAIALKSAKADVKLKEMSVKEKEVEVEERKRMLQQKRKYGDLWYDADQTRGLNPLMSMVMLLSNSAKKLGELYRRSPYGPFKLPKDRPAESLQDFLKGQGHYGPKKRK